MNYIKVNFKDLKKYGVTESLLLALVRSYNNASKVFEMKQDNIAKLFNISLRKITNAIKILKENKEIRSIRRFKKSSVLEVVNHQDTAYFIFNIDIFKLNIKVQDMVVLALLKNGYNAVDICNYMPKSTVYDAIKRLKKADLYVDVKKEVVEVKEETKEDIIDSIKNDNVIKLNTISNKNSSNNNYYKPKYSRHNRFNNFEQREYSKEEWEEINKLFFA